MIIYILYRLSTLVSNFIVNLMFTKHFILIK